MALNSSKTYRQALHSYNLFARQYDGPLNFPSNIHHLAMYISYLSYCKFAPNTILTYASAMVQTTLAASGVDLASHFLYKKLTKSLRKQKIPDCRYPITKQVLKSLISASHSMCATEYEAILFSAAFSLAFHALLRVSEFAASRMAPMACIQAQHVRLVKGPSKTFLKLTLPHSKNDQYSKSHTIRLQPLCNVDVSICPVRLMSQYLKVRSAFQHGQQLFIHADSSCLTVNQFGIVLKQCLQFAQVPYLQCYSAHSFRIGGATALAAQGCSEQEIKQAGRWRSDAYKTYLRTESLIPW
jgi:hypothetical protein